MIDKVADLEGVVAQIRAHDRVATDAEGVNLSRCARRAERRCVPPSLFRASVLLGRRSHASALFYMLPKGEGPRTLVQHAGYFCDRGRRSGGWQ